MKKTLLGFTIVLLLMISEILILNNDIASQKHQIRYYKKT